MNKLSASDRPAFAAERRTRRKGQRGFGTVFLPAVALAIASSTVEARSSDLATDQVSFDALPDCRTVPFSVGLEITTIELLVDESYANVSRQEMSRYIAKALRQTELFASVHHGLQDEPELALVIDNLELRYRSDAGEPHLRLEADVELTWWDGGELYWRSRYVAESSYAEQTPGRHGRFNLNLRMATTKLATKLAQDLNRFFLTEGLAKVSFRRDSPDGTPLTRVAVLEMGHASRADLLPRLMAMIATSLCLEPVDMPSKPAAKGEAGLLAQRFGVRLADPTVSLALIVAPWFATGARVSAVDFHLDVVLGAVEWEEAYVNPQTLELQLEAIVGVLMQAHHSAGSCRRQAYANTFGGREFGRSAVHVEP